MKLIGKYGKGGINLEGDAESFCELAQAIREAGDAREFILTIPSKDAPNPYPGLADRLVIQTTNGSVLITRDASRIGITGSSEKLNALAKNIDFAARNAQSKHQHLEFYPGHFFLAPDSVPLIITRLEK